MFNFPEAAAKETKEAGRKGKKEHIPLGADGTFGPSISPNPTPTPSTNRHVGLDATQLSQIPTELQPEFVEQQDEVYTLLTETEFSLETLVSLEPAIRHALFTNSIIFAQCSGKMNELEQLLRMDTENAVYMIGHIAKAKAIADAIPMPLVSFLANEALSCKELFRDYQQVALLIHARIITLEGLKNRPAHERLELFQNAQAIIKLFNADWEMTTTPKININQFLEVNPIVRQIIYRDSIQILHLNNHGIPTLDVIRFHEKLLSMTLDLQAELTAYREAAFIILSQTDISLDAFILLPPPVRAALYQKANLFAQLVAHTKVDLNQLIEPEPLVAVQIIENLDKIVNFAKKADLSIESCITDLKNMPEGNRQEWLDNLDMISFIFSNEKPIKKTKAMTLHSFFRVHHLIRKALYENPDQVASLNTMGISTVQIMELDADERFWVLSKPGTAQSEAIVLRLQEAAQLEAAKAQPEQAQTPRRKRSCVVS